MSKLEHVATIDYCYWRLGKLNEALSKPKSAIEQLVDKACGYNEVCDANIGFSLQVRNFINYFNSRINT